MAGRSNHSSQANPDSPNHDKIWRGSPSRTESAASWDSKMESLSRSPKIPHSSSGENMWRGSPSNQASAASWDSMMDLLSLRSGPSEERTPSRDSPPRRKEHPSLSGWASSGQSPPAQPQWRSPNLREKTLLRQLSSEQPPGALSMRPDQHGSTHSRPTASIYAPFFAQHSQPGDIIIPPSGPSHQPAGHLAAYLAVYEGRPWPEDVTRRSRRNISMIVQSSPGIDKFREFCCIPTPNRIPKRHIMFYSSPEIPDPRYGSPGLLAMQFIAWIPHWQMAVLDQYMFTLRRRVKPEWTHLTWIRIYLEDLLKEKLITIAQMEATIQFQEQALSCPYTEDLPNRRHCFPHLYQ